MSQGMIRAGRRILKSASIECAKWSGISWRAMAPDRNPCEPRGWPEGVG